MKLRRWELVYVCDYFENAHQRFFTRRNAEKFKEFIADFPGGDRLVVRRRAE